MTNEKKQIQWDRNEQEEAAVIEQTGIYEEKLNIHDGRINRFFYKREWELIQKTADKETLALLEKWIEDNQDYKGIPFPIMSISHVCENRHFIRKTETDKRLSSLYFNYKERQAEGNDKSDKAYGQLYRILAFMIFGYGNWSNNDRLRKGLAPIRKG